jgi:LysR family transcriptional activator of nhaA
VSRASAALRLAQPTISTQIRLLEEALGEKLFRREGRRLVLTDVGRVVYRYADEIFGLGRELLDTLKGRPTGRPLRLTVGVADVVPKLVTHRLLEPVRAMPGGVHLVCVEDKPERLVASLALHEVDVVIADAPVSSSVRVRVFHHLLGECGVSVLAAPALAVRLRRRFPSSLEGAPFLLPTENTVLRRALEQWFGSQGVRPRVVAEFEDSALLKTFAQLGDGAFVAPAAIEREVCEQYRARVVGRIETVRERFYAITAERRLVHPAVAALSEAARSKMFGDH